MRKTRFLIILERQVGKTHRKMNFTVFSPRLKIEDKFFIINHIQNDDLQLYSAVHNYCKSLKQLAKFLNRYYPDISSFIELDIDRALMQLRTYLSEQGLSIRIYGRRKLSNYENLLNRLFLFYQKYYDTRSEFEKDIWDVRNIPGAKYADYVSNHKLNFKDIPGPFLDLAKKYLKFRISHLSFGQCSLDLRVIKLFMTFIHKRYPLWSDLKALNRRDIEDYLVWHNQELHDKVPSKRYYLIALHVFLENIEKLQFDEAPDLPVSVLLFKEDFPRKITRTENDIKYIPEGVLQQIEERLEY